MDSIWFFLFYEHVNQNRWHHLIFLNCTTNRTQSIKWTHPIKTKHSPGYRGCSCRPLLLSLSHSPDVAWQPISISSVVEKKMGHCTVTKGHSLQIQQLRKVWAPVVSNAQRKLVLAVCGCQKQSDWQSNTSSTSSTRDMCKNSIRQKEVAESHWWRGHEALKKAVFYITSI